MMNGGSVTSTRLSAAFFSSSGHSSCEPPSPPSIAATWPAPPLRSPPSPLLLSSDSILRRFFALLLALPCALKSLLLTQRGLGGAGNKMCFSSSEVDEEADTRLDEVDDVPLRLLELLLWAVCLAMVAVDHRHSVHLRLSTGTAADTWPVELCAGRDSTDTSPALPHFYRQDKIASVESTNQVDAWGHCCCCGTTSLGHHGGV